MMIYFGLKAIGTLTHASKFTHSFFSLIQITGERERERLGILGGETEKSIVKHFATLLFRS